MVAQGHAGHAPIRPPPLPRSHMSITALPTSLSCGVPFCLHPVLPATHPISTASHSLSCPLCIPFDLCVIPCSILPATFPSCIPSFLCPIPLSHPSCIISCPTLQHPITSSVPPVIPSCVPCPIPPASMSYLCPLLTVSHPTHLRGEDLHALGPQLEWEPPRELEGREGSGAEQGWVRGHPSDIPVGTALLPSHAYRGNVPVQNPGCEVGEGS